MSALVEPFVHEPRIAYFSMEIALASEIPTYSGGLGVLAGGTMCSAAASLYDKLEQTVLPLYSTGALNDPATARRTVSSPATRRSP